jgi:hypothetical protein
VNGYRLVRVWGGVLPVCSFGCARKRDFRSWLKPQRPFLGYLSALTRTREELLAENAMLRHQGLAQKLPSGRKPTSRSGSIVARPFLNGLHHDYSWAA